MDGDGESTEKIVQRTRAGVIRVRMEIGNDWRASSVKVDEEGRIDVSCRFAHRRYEWQLIGSTCWGGIKAKNALLPWQSGPELGLGREELQTESRPTAGRRKCVLADILGNRWRWRLG